MQKKEEKRKSLHDALMDLGEKTRKGLEKMNKKHKKEKNNGS